MEEIAGSNSYTRMWKQCFDYKGTASRREYWIPFFIHVGIGVITASFAILAFVGVRAGFPASVNTICALLAIALTGYLIASIVPWISLTVRRLHDTGKSGWWTFLLLAVGIGTVIILLFCSMAAGTYAFRPSNNDPEIFDIYDPSQNVEPDVYGPPVFDDFDPYENLEPVVYGPPEMFEDEDRDSYDEDDRYIPEDNMEPTVYGPLEMIY